MAAALPQGVDKLLKPLKRRRLVLRARADGMRACCVTQGRKWCGGRRCDARHVVRGHRRGASWPVTTGAQPRWDDLFQAMLNLEATAANEMRILTEIYIYLQCIRGQMPRLRRSCRCRSVADG